MDRQKPAKSAASASHVIGLALTAFLATSTLAPAATDSGATSTATKTETVKTGLRKKAGKYKYHPYRRYYRPYPRYRRYRYWRYRYYRRYR